MFGNNKQLQALQNDNERLVKEIMSLRKDNSDYKQTISAFVGVKSGYENEVKILTEKYEKQIQKVNKELDAERRSVNRKVNKALADIGVNQFAPEEISEVKTKSSNSIYSEFISMAEGPDKQAFWKENEKLLSQLSGLTR
jgi:ABC-type Fe3+-citrate transport system substrate-binding protein